MKKNPPNIEGKWNVVEYKVINGKNTIYDPIVVKYTANFRQNERFVDSLTPYANFYGVWKYNCKSGWELIMVNNTSDNDTFNFTPFCVKNNKVITMECINWEAGTIPNTSQNAQVSWSKWVRAD